MMPTTEMILEIMITMGGCLVTSDSLGPVAIAKASQENRMFVDENGYGFIWFPSFEALQTAFEEREAG